MGGVGYTSKDSDAIASYCRQPGGTWKGVWRYGGARRLTLDLDAHIGRGVADEVLTSRDCGQAASLL